MSDKDIPVADRTCCSYHHPKVGEELPEHQQKEGFCPDCGMCLFINAEYLNDDMYPLWKCNCGKGIFWD